MPPEWISAPYASRFVAVASSEISAQFTICERAHSGLIQAKAELLSFDWKGERREKADAIIPREFWWAKGQDALVQNWQTGDFSTWIEQRDQWRVFGVSFDLAGLIDVVPVTARAKAMASIFMLGNPDWMPAIVADRYLYMSDRYAPGASQVAIIELCQTGHIAARALRMEKRSRGWDGEPESVAVEWDVPLWFWRNFTGSDSSAQQWDIGTFSGYVRCSECSGYVKLSGVHFLRESIHLIAGTATEEPTVEKAKGGPGRRKKYDWEGALLHLIGLAELDSIAPDPDAHGTQSDIAKLMADWFAENGGEVPESSQLRDYAKRALQAISQRSANN